MMAEPDTSFGSTRDGLSQLRRRWQVTEARAALLLVHGIGEHSGRYLHVGRRLADSGIDVLAFDNRGFGQSGGRRAFVESFDHYLDDVEDLLAERRSLGLPVILLGHSLGGLICTKHLVSERSQPDFAVLSAPALDADVPTWQRLLAPILGRLAPKLFVPAKIDASLLSRDVEVQRAYQEDPLVIAGATAGMGLEMFNAMTSTSATVDHSNAPLVPTMVIHGDADGLVPLRASDGLARLEAVERRVWPGLRHELFNEPEQDAVLDELLVWIDSQLSGG